VPSGHLVTDLELALHGDEHLDLFDDARRQLVALPEELDPLLGIGCPTILFPYLRETISDLITRGGFPPILLAPVSFEAIYMQRMQQAQGSQPKIEVAR